jgi:hypothetical protein
VARVLKFVDIWGFELHKINDPEDKLPIPEIRQVISIGSSRMRVESERYSEAIRVHPVFIMFEYGLLLRRTSLKSDLRRSEVE